MSAQLVARITNMARACAKDSGNSGVLSTGERCAVALVLNCADCLPDGYTFLDAVQRLDEGWLEACASAAREFTQHEAECATCYRAQHSDSSGQCTL